jgi:phage terminase large subunit-like protein
MDREAFQGEAVDEIWLDEDISRTDDSIYGECLARLTTTRGVIMCSLSPLLGMSPLRKRFKERARTGECVDIVMTIDDARVSNGGHIPDDQVASIVAGYKASERATRAYGADMQGEGAVFETPTESIKHSHNPNDFPLYWRWLWGVDFRHSGAASGGHPFAAVLGCRDPDNDIIYIVHAVRLYGLAPVHVAAIRANPMKGAPVAWPHDGGRGAGLILGETIAQTYRKLGLNMRPTHAVFPDGGYNFEAGIAEMENRFALGKLKIAAHLTEALDEYQGYHRVDGLVHKVDDDIMSAIRILCMDIRFAKPVEQFADAPARRAPTIARDVDFDLFAPQS